MFSGYVEPWVLASHNVGKLREFQTLLEPYGLRMISAVEAGVPEPEETGATFMENALLKAHHAAKHTGRIALADDSGLSVDALSGAPGIYSARWAGETKDFSAAMARVSRELEVVNVAPQGASARFVCALALAWPNGEEHGVEGQVEGALTFPPRGDKGFGYDPIFVPQGYSETFAEMEATVKAEISHRTRAFAALQQWLAQQQKERA